MALSLNFDNISLNDILYGKYDTYEIRNLRQTECGTDGFIDVSVQFTEIHATIAYLRDSGTVPMIALHRMLSHYGVNAVFPNEVGYKPWPLLVSSISAFLANEAEIDADRMDCYGVILSMIYRYKQSPFGCVAHGLTIDASPFKCHNYDPSCFFCLSTLLLFAMSNASYKPAPVNTIINLDVVMDISAQLTAFAFHVYSLFQHTYIECDHARCMAAINCGPNQDDLNISGNCTRGALSTRGLGANSAITILRELQRVDCTLNGSLYQSEERRSNMFALERLVAFNFATATRVVSALLARVVPNAKLIMRGYRTGHDRNMRYKLVIRMPIQRVNVDTIKDVMMAYPSVMLRIGASGFMIREFSSEDDNGYGSVIEKQYSYHIYYELCKASIDDITIVPELQMETRRHNIIEVAHQMVVNDVPVMQRDENAFLKLIRLYELGIAEHFPFAEIRFGSDNDTRTFLHLIRTPTLEGIQTYGSIYNVINHKKMHFVGQHILQQYYSSMLASSLLNVELRFIIRFTDDYQKTQTIVIPPLCWELYEESAEITDKEPLDYCVTHDELSTIMIEKRNMYFNDWVRMRRTYRFIIKSINCRDEC